MKKIQTGKLEKALSGYFEEIHKIYVAGNFREESFYSSLKGLIEECSQFCLLQSEAGVLVQPKKTELERGGSYLWMKSTII